MDEYFDQLLKTTCFKFENKKEYKRIAGRNGIIVLQE